MSKQSAAAITSNMYQRAGLQSVCVQVLAAFICVAVLIMSTTAFAQKRKARPTITTLAKYAILIDANSGAVLLEKRADDLMSPASMSKLMTMLMVFEAIKAGELSLDDDFHISENAWRRGGATSGGSTMYAKLNSTIKLRDLVQGVIVQSGNDACIAIAEGMAGTEDTFAQNMTLRARELGLKKSTFMNATGLPHPKHKSTARELAFIARRLIYDLNKYYHYYSQKEFTWNKISQKNRNPLLYQNIGADGLKTGYIREAGYGLVASAKRKGQRLILVINGMKSSRKRSSEARKLLDWGFRAFKPFTVFKANEEIGLASVWGGTKPYLKLVTHEPISVMLTRDQRKNIKAEIVYTGPIQAPIKKGTQIGKLRLTAKGGITNELPLYAGEDIKRGGLWARAFGSLVFLALGG